MLCRVQQLESPASPAFASPLLDPQRLKAGVEQAVGQLLSERVAAGHWEGELASSALATTTAVIALATIEANSRADARTFQKQTGAGLRWLAQHANPDGGWGDTSESISNISTTTLCWAAFGAVSGAEANHAATLEGAERWLSAKTGAPAATLRNVPAPIVSAVIERYGEDRTFSVPILTACALSGRLGAGSEAWQSVLPLPFELAAMPHQFFAALRLPVVSYALPALIAIGQVRHFHRPPRNPLLRALRDLARSRTLKVLASIQPQGGGFLEATPLTSFVVMSLAGSQQAEHPVTKAGLEFLLKSQRPNGSWPIDTNLATWVTTLAINALDQGRNAQPSASAGEKPDAPAVRPYLTKWLLTQQTRAVHPYTHARPGAWAWTPLPGGVPDADDTAGAVLALRNLNSPRPGAPAHEAAISGIKWLLDLQNRDGGIPTFCRGWGKLPFDRSSPDLTAHALRAWLAWLDQLPVALRRRIEPAVTRALAYLRSTQRSDGSWVPLWFGNQQAPGDQNPCYGTARVILALVTARAQWPEADALLARGAGCLLKMQTAGGWGGAIGVEPSVEETALALDALASLRACTTLPAAMDPATLDRAIIEGTHWLLARVESGAWKKPAPIGFYFASLWYSERLYPQIFTVGALARVARLMTL